MATMDRVYSILEYVLAALFIRGGVMIFLFFEPPEAPSILTLLVGEAAIYGYGIFFAMTGLALLYAKLCKNKKVHKWALFAMFIICCYVFGLSVAIAGLSMDLATTVIVGIASAVLYLRWKMRTEYVDPAEFAIDPKGTNHGRD